MCTPFDSLTCLEPTPLHSSHVTSPSQSVPLLQTMSFLGFSLLSFFILTSILLVSSQNDNEYEDVVKTVKKINKHVLPTIKRPDGDLIDKQNKPSFNHSILRDHTIQEVPAQMLKRKKYARNSRIYNKAFQICLRNRMMCTNNTIPVRRSTIADVMRLNSTSEFKTKQKSFQHQLPIFTENHEYATVVYDAVPVLYAVAGAIKIARPSVFGENGCSQAHVQIRTGSGQDFESITVGWNVCPVLNGDNNIRLFLLWTRDGYQTTKCYNYECNGFVAENDEDNEDDVVLGDELEPSPAHPDIYVKIWKDPVRQIWSLMIDDDVMGEWRRDIFLRLGGIYTSVEWGGEVSNNRTQMGSGRFENEEGACYICNLEIMTLDNPHHLIQVPFEELTERETNPELAELHQSAVRSIYVELVTLLVRHMLHTMNFSSCSLLAFFILTSILVSAQNYNEYEDVVKTVRKIYKYVLPKLKGPHILQKENFHFTLPIQVRCTNLGIGIDLARHDPPI
ncbi:uncharacterized protein LOC119987710 [Tripterygium wilfordii]|uniref:uncharacterized protein LOC119987710 n=1 Tax=Tripterygium wilfordii TaxID=458696 RepID=UPI0018F82008|nr:uncharacterized protein LOC119987710 [Tripterygium wilfordii]